MDSNKIDKIVASILQNKNTDESLTIDNFSLVSDIKSEINTGTDFSHEKDDQLTIDSKKLTSASKSSVQISHESNKDSIKSILNPRKEPYVNKKVLIDVAVLCQEYANVETMCDDNIINLDEIPISQASFQQIFYPYCENFGINKEHVCCNDELSTYVSFLPEFRYVCHSKFYLLEAIIANIEKDLNISRNCFTKESLVELTNEMISIKSLCDINCCSVFASLTWSNIIEIINNYKLIKICKCVCHVDKTCKLKCNCDNSCNYCDVIPILVINIIFKTPTEGVRNTIVRFNYRITDL